MFFVILFLILVALTIGLFPEWSWGAVLATSLGIVAVLRLVLHFVGRKDTGAADENQR